MLVLHLDLLSIFQKFEQIMAKFNSRFNGLKFWNELDERFKCRTSNQFKKEL